MFWSEPEVCPIVRQHLAEGNAIAAAQALLAENACEHSAVKRLKQRTIKSLLQSVEEQIALRIAPCDPATECDGYLELATALGAGADQIAKAAECLKKHRSAAAAKRKWKQNRLQQARQLARKGRLVSAAQWLPERSVANRPGSSAGNNAHQTETDFLRQDWEQELAQLDRRLEEAKQHLELGHWSAARECWKMAAAVARLDPRVVALDKELKRAGQETQPWDCPSIAALRLNQCVIQTPRPIPPSTHRPMDESLDHIEENVPAVTLAPSDVLRPLVLDSGATRWLIMMADSFVLGGCTGDEAPPVNDRELRLKAKLRSRQLAVMRDGDTVRVATPWKTRGCSINGVALANDDRMQPLADGDSIALESGRVKFSVRQTEGRGSMQWKVDPRTPLNCLRGRPVHGIVLFHESMTIGGSKQATCPLAELGDGTIVLCRSDLRLTATSTDRVIWWEPTPEPEVPSPSLTTSLIGLLRASPIPNGVDGLMDIFSGYSEGFTSLKLSRLNTVNATPT